MSTGEGSRAAGYLAPALVIAPVPVALLVAGLPPTSLLVSGPLVVVCVAVAKAWSVRSG
jgi:hypothetical protein